MRDRFSTEFYFFGVEVDILRSDTHSVEINSKEKLEKWLVTQVPAVRPTIALRIALRLLPFALNPNRYRAKDRHDVEVALFRACVILWVALSREVQSDRQPTIAAAAYAAQSFPGHIADQLAYLGARTVADAAASFSDPTAGPYADVDDIILWQNIQRDCDSISAGTFPKDLITKPLWDGPYTEALLPDLVIMDLHLVSVGQGFNLWNKWYGRRFNGKISNFGIPQEKEKILNARLINASDEWWRREPAVVNGQIQSWIDELTPKIDFEEIQLRTTNGATPQFGSDEELHRRAELQTRIMELQRELADVHPQPAVIGHNRPPVDLDNAEVADAPAVVQEARDLTVALAAELQPAKPDILAVIEKLSRLQKIGRWLAKIGNLFAESAAKAAGTTVGTLLGGISLSSLLPGTQADLGPVLQSGWSWLQSLIR